MGGSMTRQPSVAPDPQRIGGAEVMHGADVVLLVLRGTWPGSAQLTPDQADALAGRLREQAAYAREIREREP